MGIDVEEAVELEEHEDKNAIDDMANELEYNDFLLWEGENQELEIRKMMLRTTKELYRVPNGIDMK